MEATGESALKLPCQVLREVKEREQRQKTQLLTEFVDLENPGKQGPICDSWLLDEDLFIL